MQLSNFHHGLLGDSKRMDTSNLTESNKHELPIKAPQPSPKRASKATARAKAKGPRNRTRQTAKIARSLQKAVARRKTKALKLVCRYCGSDDLAPSFIKRRDRRCRKCFSKRYGATARTKRPRSKGSRLLQLSVRGPDLNRCTSSEPVGQVGRGNKRELSSSELGFRLPPGDAAIVVAR